MKKNKILIKLFISIWLLTSISILITCLITLSMISISLNSIFTAVLLSLLTAIFPALFTNNLLMKDLNYFEDYMVKVINGNLNCKMDIKENDDLKHYKETFNLMCIKLKSFIEHLNDSTEKLLDFANNINSLSEETTYSMTQVGEAINTVASGASLQSSNMQDCSDTVEILNNNMNAIDTEINNISSLSIQALSLSETGMEAIKTLTNSTKLNKENYSHYMINVNDMTSCINDIDSILDSILEISRSTKFVSLNAAIEAEKAGNNGRSFSVIAHEMQKLCEKTCECANSIQAIVDEINSKTNVTKDTMKKSTDMFNKQIEDVKNTIQVFNDISSAVEDLYVSINSIQDLNNTMKESKNDFNIKIDDICLIAQETASISEEVSASTEEVNSRMEHLTEYANKLNEIAYKFEKNINIIN